jgi:hypothetical protein
VIHFTDALRFDAVDVCIRRLQAKVKRALQLKGLEALKADIEKGLADLAAGRVEDFDAARIIKREEVVIRPLALRLTFGR